jgi:putative holliday junction resolvase
MPRIAAVDFGLKRIGIAVSDENKRIAVAQKMVLAGKNLQQTARLVIMALLPYQGQIERILIGLPLMLNGKIGEMAMAAKRFADALRKETDILIEMMDERLSTRQVERSLKELYTRKERTQIIDSASAALLLQTYLDKSHESP